MRLSIRFALCLAVALPLLVSLAGLAVLGLFSRDLRAERDAQLTARLHALTPAAASFAWRAAALPDVPADVLEQRVTAAAQGSGSPGGVYVEVPGGTPLAVGDVPRALPAPPAAGPAGFAEGGRRWRYVSAALGRDGAARLWVFDPEDRLAAQVRLLGRRLVTVTLIAAAVGAVAGVALGGFAVRPLARLGRQARAIGTPARTGARLTTTARVTEIDELARLLNDLLDRRDAAVARTGEALETARAFAATAAHELRTPLTSMRTNLALLHHPGLGQDDRAEIIADLDAEQGRIERLITMLRQLARGELLDPASFGRADLAGIVTAAVEDARRRHPHAVITASVGGDVEVRGWAEGLRLVADNLLDNAALHGARTAPNGDGALEGRVAGGGRAEIGVTLARDGDVVVLTVEDAGPGIPPDDRERVFARFHRRPGSPGSGLGLTLVGQQAALHGGTVTLTSPPGGGTRVEVRLPSPSAPPARGALPENCQERPP
uniref:sensor histidine kinase n=1 Tax=Nonomuraea pusilla TaxID=46177 RepID=UPI0007C7B5E6|nr:HAMP domain-containing sensor histidine kinase [Nonomuraea pusilla]